MSVSRRAQMCAILSGQICEGGVGQIDGAQATRERFTEYIAVMKKAFRDAAEASAAHSAGIQLQPDDASAQAHPPPGKTPPPMPFCGPCVHSAST